MPIATRSERTDHPTIEKDAWTIKQQALLVVDLRTGTPYQIPIEHNAIAATQFARIKAPENIEHPADQSEYGLRVFDPGFQNTAVSQSAITYVSVAIACFQLGSSLG